MKVLLVRYKPEYQEVTVEAGGLWIDTTPHVVSIRHEGDDDAGATIAWLGDDGWHHKGELYASVLIQP